MQTTETQHNKVLCAPPFHSNEHGNGWTTAGHVVLNGDGGENTIYQITGPDYLDNYKDRDTMGVSRDGHTDGLIGSNLDYAFIEPNSSERISTQITNPEGTEKQLELTGILSNEELENHVGDDDYTMYTQGVTTERTEGTIENMAGQSQAVVTSNSIEDGDSGGPLFYKPNEDEAYIAGILFKKTFGNAASTTAETTEIELDGYFLWG